MANRAAWTDFPRPRIREKMSRFLGVSPMVRWSLVVVAVLASGGILMYFLNPGQAQVAEKKERSGFAADREPELPKIAFNGERALKYLKAVCDIGPRMSGTPGMKKQQELIRKHFQDLGA